MDKIDKYFARELTDTELENLISERIGFYRIYTHSHDAIDCALAKLERSIQICYVDTLRRNTDHHDFMEYEIVLATPRQKAEALLMTLVNNSIDLRLDTATHQK